MRHKKTSYLGGVQLLRESYDQMYGTYDYVEQVVAERKKPPIDKYRPLSSVALHPAEDYIGTGREFWLTEKFVDLKIGTHFCISFIEFLEMPRWMIDFMIAKAEKMKAKEENLINSIGKPPE